MVDYDFFYGVNGSDDETFALVGNKAKRQEKKAARQAKRAEKRAARQEKRAARKGMGAGMDMGGMAPDDAVDAAMGGSMDASMESGADAGSTKSTTDTGSGDTGSGDTSAGMDMNTKIAIGVGAAVVLGVGLYFVMKR